MKHVFLFILWLFFIGCASQPKPNLSRSEAAKVDWGSRIGKYSYDQAVADLGQPATFGESSEGRWGEWTLKRSPQMSFGFGVGTSTHGSRGGVGVGAGSTVTPPPSGLYLHLDFGPDSQLKGWRKVQY